MLFILLSGCIFYSINENADRLKGTFGLLNSSIIPSQNIPPDNHNFLFNVEASPVKNRKVICVQLEGVIFCRES